MTCVAARRLVLVNPAVPEHLEEARGIGLSSDAVICVAAAHDLADQVVPGPAVVAAAAAAAAECPELPELHLCQLFLAPCDAHLQSDAVV